MKWAIISGKYSAKIVVSDLWLKQKSFFFFLLFFSYFSQWYCLLMLAMLRLLIISVFCCTEYSNQLPSEGGAFYHPDTVETVIPHYRKSWPAILHGLAIWLNDTGFEYSTLESADDKDVGRLLLGSSAAQAANAPANMRARSMNQDRFFLILGKTHHYW